MNAHVAPLPAASFEAGPAVVVSNLLRSYGSRVVIEKLNLRIERGEFVALLGESGCGKTTLLRALAGLDAIQGGRIVAPRRPAFKRSRKARINPLCLRRLWVSSFKRIFCSIGSTNL